MTEPSVVLVHGAHHGAWCWERVVDELQVRGVRSSAVDLPYSSYEDDEATVRRAIDEAKGPVILVGHSLGGGLVCAAGDHPRVRQLGFITAMVVGRGESVPERLERQGVRPEFRTGAPDVAPGIQLTPDGWVTVDPVVAAATFFAGCSPADIESAVARLRPMSQSSAFGLPRDEPWRVKPSNYVFCTQDRAVPLEVQRAFAAGLQGTTHEIAASHSPFLSHPADVGAIIAEWVHTARAG